MKQYIVGVFLLIIVVACTPPLVEDVRGNPSKTSDTTLSSITSNVGTLTPPYSKEVYDYSIRVGPSVASISIEATSSDSKATLSGTFGENLPLSVGDNSFNVNVQAPNSQSRTYTVKVFRDTGASWAKVISGDALIDSNTVDSLGNMYVVGRISGQCTFGSSLTIQGSSSGYNAVLTKFSPTGTPLWAVSTTTGNLDSGFTSVVADASGNVYVTGFQQGGGINTYGTDAQVTTNGIGRSLLICKITATGTVAWAKTSGLSNSSMYIWGDAIALDNEGYLRLVGAQAGLGTFSLGQGIVHTNATNINGGFIAKYDLDGNAQWFSTVTGNSSGSAFQHLSLDSNGTAYIGGAITGGSSSTFGSQTVSSIQTDFVPWDGLMLTFDKDGNCLWAQVANFNGTTPRGSNMKSPIPDGTGGFYILNHQWIVPGSDTWIASISSSKTQKWINKVDTVGTSLNYFPKLLGTSSGDLLYIGIGGRIDRYSSNGTKKSTGTTPGYAETKGAVLDSEGFLCLLTSQSGTTSITYAPGLSIAGTSSGSTTVLARIRL